MPEEDFFFSQNPSKKNCNDQASVSSLWILVFPYLVGSSSHQWYICIYIYIYCIHVDAVLIKKPPTRRILAFEKAFSIWASSLDFWISAVSFRSLVSPSVLCFGH